MDNPKTQADQYVYRKTTQATRDKKNMSHNADPTKMVKMDAKWLFSYWREYNYSQNYDFRNSYIL